KPPCVVYLFADDRRRDDCALWDSAENIVGIIRSDGEFTVVFLFTVLSAFGSGRTHHGRSASAAAAAASGRGCSGAACRLGPAGTAGNGPARPARTGLSVGIPSRPESTAGARSRSCGTPAAATDTSTTTGVTRTEPTDGTRSRGPVSGTGTTVVTARCADTRNRTVLRTSAGRAWRGVPGRRRRRITRLLRATRRSGKITACGRS